jgi:serine/threonine protein phosphatase 1
MMIDEALAPATLPAGTRIYAIGDVHGCADRLARLHGLIAADAAARPVARAIRLQLGDYVDRGEDSRGVLAALAAPPPAGIEAVNLIGNHEEMLLAALHPAATPDVRALWLDNGGWQALRSWGIDPRDRAGWAQFPRPDLDWLRGLPDRFACGGYFFAHAGIRPGLPLAAQQRTDLLWIRETFLHHRGPLPAVVVHGHTPCPTPEVTRWRIGIDTGAVFGGDLTCAVLEADRIGFLVA